MPVEPTAEQLEWLATADLDGPVVMVNLLRFREEAQYDGDPDPGGTGEEAYGRYAAVALAKVGERGGRVVYAGTSPGTVIGDEIWDQVALVEYPSREAFFDMLADPEYAEAARHRSAGLADTRLIVTSALSRP